MPTRTHASHRGASTLHGLPIAMLFGPPIDTVMTGHNIATIHESIDMTGLTTLNFVPGLKLTAADTLHELTDGTNGLTQLVVNPLKLTGTVDNADTATVVNLTTVSADTAPPTALHRMEVGRHGFDGSATGAMLLTDDDLGDPRDVGCLRFGEDPQRLAMFNGTGFGGKVMTARRCGPEEVGLIGRITSGLRRGFTDMAGLVKVAFTGTGASMALAA